MRRHSQPRSLSMRERYDSDAESPWPPRKSSRKQPPSGFSLPLPISPEPSTRDSLWLGLDLDDDEPKVEKKLPRTNSIQTFQPLMFGIEV
mmetsp:Transcript_19743/g.63489  ORF Transcript_19743/g.63489 Transcript_19743/m.63489 type:complete len:90 (-) Transcript_19743:416-685(-)